jgi:chromate transporter
MAFGGLGATLALLERELAERRHVVTRDEITDALTYTKLLPGSTVVQVVAYLGWRLGGWSASALMTVCFLLPSAILMLGLAYGYSRVEAIPAIGGMRRAVLSVVVAMLLLTMYRLAKPVLSGPLSVSLAVVAFAMVAGFHISAGWVVVGAGLVGMIAARRQASGSR